MVLLLIILYTLVLITSGIIIIYTNSSSKALAYLLLVVLIPGIGIILYFTVGVNYRKRKLYNKKLVIDKQKYPQFEERFLSLSNHFLHDNQQRLDQFYPLANNSSLTRLTSCNQVDLLINGEEKYPRLLHDLRQANHFIHLEYYIFESDEIGNQIADILIAKAQAGIKVRMIYDDFGSSGLSNAFIRRLKENKVEAVPFFKIRWLLFANRINYRNHRKIVVIDGKIGFVGGINISDKYDNDKKNKLYWRDTSIRLEGMAVASLQYAFLVDWNFCSKQNISFSTDLFPFNEKTLSSLPSQLIQTALSGPDSDYPNILYAMVQAIHLCKKELLITTPYFIPTTTLIDALKIAKLSGVDVKLLVPGISDSKLVNAISNSYYDELLELDIEIYKYQKGFVHAKTMVCDGQVSFVGTTNLDQRSFELNFEIHQVIYDDKIAEQMRSAFFNDLKSSQQIDKNKWNDRSYLTFFTERVARLMSPLI